MRSNSLAFHIFHGRFYFIKMTNYLVSVNGKETPVKMHEVASVDMIQIDNAHYHILENNKAHSISVLQTDYLNKTLKVLVNGNTYDVKIEDEYDQKVKQMGLLAVTSQKINSINAPMPGLIIDVMVEEGQEISVGTPLLVLSAMKMENIVLSQGEGIVKSIAVQKDDAVEKGQLIIEME